MTPDIKTPFIKAIRCFMLMMVIITPLCVMGTGTTASDADEIIISEVYATAQDNSSPDLILREDELAFTPGESRELNISLDNGTLYTAIQFDMYLPEGLSLSGDPESNYGGRINSKDSGGNATHSLGIRKVSNGSCRFIAYSTGNKSFSTTDNLITVTIDVGENFSGGTLSFKDIILSKGDEGTTVADKSYNVRLAEIAITSITLDKSEITLRASETATLNVTYNPANATNKEVTWTSSASSVATVSKDGVVTAVSVGTATITATTPNAKTATATVTVEPTPATSVTITRPQNTTLKVGESVTLSTVVLPELTTDKTISWSSSNTGVATVSAEGKVTAVGAGNVEITATCGKVSDKISFNVTQEERTITLNASEFTIEKGGSITLIATVQPSVTGELNLEWSSSDNSVATVNASGVVSGVKAGTATITVKEVGTGLSASCKITVTDIDIIYGDVNGDGHIAINDVVLIVDYILENNPSDFNKERADIDRNGVINVIDVTKAIELVLAQTPENVKKAQASMNTRSPNDIFSIGTVGFPDSGIITIPVSLDTDVSYTALQMDIELPENLEMVKADLGSSQRGDHVIESVNLDKSVVRLIVFSSTLAAITANETLLTLRLKATDTEKYFDGGYLALSNGIASMNNGKGEALTDAGITIKPFSDVEELRSDKGIYPETGGIRICSEPGSKISIFNISGNAVISRKTTGDDFYGLSKGLYIIVINGTSYKVNVP